MTDTPDPPSVCMPAPETVPQPAPRPEPVAAPASKPAPAPKPRGSAWPGVFVLGFVVLAGGEAYLWYDAQAHRADTTQLAVLQAQMNDMRDAAARAAPPPDSAVVQANLAQKLIDLTATVNAMQAQTAADHGAMTQIQAAQTDLTRLTARITALNALEGARLALEDGRPLGVIPGAPQALAQFATVAPPREAALKEAFPEAAQAADAASIAGAAQGGLWAKVRLRLESLITVSQGTQVVFGPPAAGALEVARAALNADDLAGAVTALQTMPAPAQAAMADWIAQAKSLLAARAALAALAQGS
jgi:hypothetical protein